MLAVTGWPACHWVPLAGNLELANPVQELSELIKTASQPDINPGRTLSHLVHYRYSKLKTKFLLRNINNGNSRQARCHCFVFNQQKVEVKEIYLRLKMSKGRVSCHSLVSATKDGRSSANQIIRE
eukprot:13400361-Ditylum_brightwellii.AAC.1